MPTGMTTSISLEQGKDTIINAARTRREYPTGMVALCEIQNLPENQGDVWSEFVMEKMDAQNVSETGSLDNYQQYTGSLLYCRPLMAGNAHYLSRLVKQRLNKKVLAQIGTQLQNGIMRKKDIDGHYIINGAGVQIGASGDSLTIAQIAAAMESIMFGKGAEPGMEPIVAMLHGYQILGVKNQLMRISVNNNPIPTGISQETIRTGEVGVINGVTLYRNNLIKRDGNTDAVGGAWGKGAIVCVQGFDMLTFTKDFPDRIGGTAIYHYDQYGYVERSKGNHLVAILTDATDPTA